MEGGLDGINIARVSNAYSADLLLPGSRPGQLRGVQACSGRGRSSHYQTWHLCCPSARNLGTSISGVPVFSTTLLSTVRRVEKQLASQA